MRRWLATLVGITAITVAGTALAMTGSEEPIDEKAATDTTVKVKTTADEPIERKPIREKMLTDDELPELVVTDEPVVVEKPVVDEEPVDDIPPEVEILYPENGQVFEQKEVVFEGTTEPGAKVFAGKYEADVSDEGSWRIVLYLGNGENVVTFKAIDDADNHATDSVTVIYQPPEKVEQPKHEEPKEEEPKEDEPKEEEPKEHEWEFTAHQVYGECDESPPYDVFHGTGKPGSVIHVTSEFGSGSAQVGEEGHWEIKVIFESAPVGEAFTVKVKDEFGNHEMFEFIHIG